MSNVSEMAYPSSFYTVCSRKTSLPLVPICTQILIRHEDKVWVLCLEETGQAQERRCSMQ